MLPFLPVYSFEASRTLGDRTLLVYIRMDGPTSYRVFAVETAKGVTSLEALFKDHGHTVIEERVQSLALAYLAANEYAKKWRPQKVDDCGYAPLEGAH